MNIQNILVAFNGSEASEAALAFAASIARPGSAHVTALLAYARHEAVDSRAAWVPEQARKIITDASADILNGIETRFDSLRDGLGLGERLHFMRVSGRVDAVLSECARNYDLIVVGRRGSDRVDEKVTIHPDRIALMSGRPVLVAAPGPDADASRKNAVIAWDGSRASARALSDGLTLLGDHTKVTVVTVNGTELPRPVSEIMDHLARHRVDATHVALPMTRSVGDTLLAYCAEHDPSMLVMGAYEHSKFREDFLGGVTATVLRKIEIPVLLSH